MQGLLAFLTFIFLILRILVVGQGERVQWKRRWVMVNVDGELLMLISFANRLR